MKPRFHQSTVVRCLAATAFLLVNACSDVDEEAIENQGESEDATAQGALFDSSTMDGTAKLALVAAAKASIRSESDPLNPFFAIDPQQVEYCGLIFKKSNGTFHASSLQTSYDNLFCGFERIPIPAGSKPVGYYHSHTPASVPGLSPKDITAAKNSNPKLVYYVVSTQTKCGQKYDPTLGGNPTSIGCLAF